MTKACGAPKCKLCGHEHWIGQPHIDLPPLRPVIQHPGRPKPKPPATPVKDRKDYLRVKAIERRARERAAADKLGLTVKAYRATKRKQNDGGKDQQLQTGQDDG